MNTASAALHHMRPVPETIKSMKSISYMNLHLLLVEDFDMFVSSKMIHHKHKKIVYGVF